MKGLLSCCVRTLRPPSTIIKLIRSNKFDEISITNLKGETFTVRAKKQSKGLFSPTDVLSIIKSKKYQKITASTVDGKIINITQEETLKL
jgi:hypothetical protein